MRTKLASSLIAVLVIAVAVAAGTASACLIVTMTLTPNSGPGGTMVTADSVGGSPNTAFTLYWDGSVIATGTTDSSGNGTASFMVPPDASVGGHLVEYEEGTIVMCSAGFTVTAATQDAGVQPDAYASVSSLPATGLVLLVPAAGLALAGAGLLYRRRRV